jgi:hypothetical protein
LINIRVTCDIDNKSRLNLFFILLKGFLLTRKFPEIEKSSKGYHLIYRNLKISYKKHFLYRLFLGDDLNRIRLDLNPLRIGQVLFNEKRVYIRENNVWRKVNNCSLCGLPLTLYWFEKNGKFYCENCIKIKDLEIREKVERIKEERFLNFINRIHNLLK